MIVTNILEFSVILNGPAQAMQPLVSVYYNEDNYSAVRKVINISVKISLIEGFILSTVLFIFADYVPAIFGIYEPETVKCCVNAVRIVSSTFTILSILYLFETYYVILGKNTIAVISLFARSLIFIIMLAIPLGLAWNINGIWVGFAAAPLLTLIFCSILLYRMYGRKKFPLYLEKKNITADFDVMLTSENVMKLRDDVEKLLTVSSVPSDVINKVMLLIEETGMMIIEFNKGGKIFAEYTIEISDDKQVKIIIRDNGKIFNITDEDMKITSFRSYFLAGLMSIEKYKKSITTISLNRNIFRIKS